MRDYLVPRCHGASLGHGNRYPFAARGVAQPGSALRSGRRGPPVQIWAPRLSARRESAGADSRRGNPACGGHIPEGARCLGRKPISYVIDVPLLGARTGGRSLASRPAKAASGRRARSTDDLSDVVRS